MKKKEYDRQKTAELLQKLQAAVLSQKERRQTSSPDQDEIAFQQKIAGMLNRISPENEKKPEKTTSEKRKKSSADTPAPAFPPSSAEPDIETGKNSKAKDPVAIEPSPSIPEPQTAAKESNKQDPEKTLPEPSPKKAKSRKKKKPQDAEPAPEPEAETPNVHPRKAVPEPIADRSADQTGQSDATDQASGVKDPVTEKAEQPKETVQAVNSDTRSDPSDASGNSGDFPSRSTPEKEARDASPLSIRKLTADPSESFSEPGSAPAVNPPGEKKLPDALRNLTEDLPFEKKAPQDTQIQTAEPKREPERSSVPKIDQKGIANSGTKTAPGDPPQKKPKSEPVTAKQPQSSGKSLPASDRSGHTSVIGEAVRPAEAKTNPKPQADRPSPAGTGQPEAAIRISPSAPQTTAGTPIRISAPAAEQRPIPHTTILPAASVRVTPKVLSNGADPTVPARSEALPPISKQRETMQNKETKKTTPNTESTAQTKSVPAQPPIPPADRAPAPAPSEPGKAQKPIVIQPHSDAPSAPPIVIKPRQNGKAPTEPPKELKKEPEKLTPATSTATVAGSHPEKKPQADPPSEQKKAAEEKVTPKKEQRPTAEAKPKAGENGATIKKDPSTPKTGQRSPAKTKSTPGVSLPRPHIVKSAVEKLPRIPKKAPARSNTPIKPLPEDENLDEALDGIITDESMPEILPMEEPDDITVTQKNSSVFTRRREKKAQQAEQALGAISLIEKKTGMTEDDIAMIFELGYENELGRLVGYDTLKKLKSEHIRRLRKNDGRNYRTSYGYRNTEYTGAQTKNAVLANYAHDKKTLILRLFFTALITLLLIPIDLPMIFGSVLEPYRTAYPFLFPLAGILLLIPAGLLSYRQLNAGIRSFFRFTPTPYSLNAVLFPIAILHGILSLLFVGSTEIVPANLAVSFSLLLSAACDALRVSDEMRVFRIASAEGDKTVLDPAEPRKKKLRHGDKIVKIINDDVDANLYRVRKSEQITGFFRRCNDLSSASRPFMILICTMLALSFVGGLAGAVRSDSLAGALSAFITVLAFTTPTVAVFLFFYPLCSANKTLEHCNCALIGEESVSEYSEPKTVIFNDSDMYAAQKCTQISVREGEDFRRDMRLAGILFRKMSGTLGAVGQNAPMKNTVDPPVAFVRLTENGTEALVDSHNHLLAGNAEFMTKNGVRVPKESTDRTLRRAGNTSLMYVAIDGVLKLSYEIEYTVARSFEEMVRVLAQTDTAVAIQTYDPNLNEAFLQTSRPHGAEYVRVIKPGRYEQDAVQEVVDSGVVALGKTFDLARPLTAASSVRRVKRMGYRLQLFGALLGGAIGIILSLNQTDLLPGAPLLLALVWRALCLTASLIASFVFLQKSNRK